jgi:hypothetical protein
VVEAEGVPMFCERCAALTRSLTFDPAAEPRPEVMSGSCRWADEIHPDWCIECHWSMRKLFHLRYQLTVGEAVAPEAVANLIRLEEQFPHWPFFRPERRSPEIAERVRRMVRRNSRKFCVDMERLEREWRKR